jgi:NADPH-dependent 2,4-dienoyl-CoA reductase/sulfur reductase-like enzyme
MDEGNFPWAEFYKRAIVLQIRIVGWSNNVAICPGGLGFQYNSLKRSDWLALYELATEGQLRVVKWSEGIS